MPLSIKHPLASTIAAAVSTTVAASALAAAIASTIAAAVSTTVAASTVAATVSAALAASVATTRALTRASTVASNPSLHEPLPELVISSAETTRAVCRYRQQRPALASSGRPLALATADRHVTSSMMGRSMMDTLTLPPLPPPSLSTSREVSKYVDARAGFVVCVFSQMLVEVGVRVVALNTGIERWHARRTICHSDTNVCPFASVDHSGCGIWGRLVTCARVPGVQWCTR